MNAKRCDRCGKFYQASKEKSKYILMNNDPTKAYKRISQVDLCENCLKALERWMKNDN